jgi:hypothetical protein
MSAFDKWLTTEPAWTPLWIDAAAANADDDFFVYAPPDETKCKRCGCPIGSWLGYDRETTADTLEFTGFYVMDEEYTVLLCEDCAMDEPCECGGDHDGGRERCVLDDSNNP